MKRDLLEITGMFGGAVVFILGMTWAFPQNSWYEARQVIGVLWWVYLFGAGYIVGARQKSNG